MVEGRCGLDGLCRGTSDVLLREDFLCLDRLLAVFEVRPRIILVVEGYLPPTWQPHTRRVTLLLARQPKWVLSLYLPDQRLLKFLLPFNRQLLG